MNKPPSERPVSAPKIQALPLAFKIATQPGGPDGAPWVLLSVHSPIGTFVFFLDSKAAKGLASALRSATLVVAGGLS